MKLAQEEEADQIVIGVERRSNLSKLILGSVARYVIRYSHCPVLTVRWPPQRSGLYKTKRRRERFVGEAEKHFGGKGEKEGCEKEKGNRIDFDEE